MHETASPSSFDWLVLTAANHRQADAYRIPLQHRAERETLGTKRFLVVPDAMDARIGSGGATVLALLAVAQKLLDEVAPEKQLQGRTDTKLSRGSVARASTIEQLFAHRRMLMLHSGGDSRRLPMYAVQGKLFATLPIDAGAGRCGTLFDLLLNDLLSLPARKGGEVLIAAGDCVLGIAKDPVQFAGRGVIGVAQRAPEERAWRHGVFVRSNTSPLVNNFLQKPTHEQLVAAGALASDGTALVDTGLISLDPAAVAALLAGAGVQLRHGKLMVTAGSFADQASRGVLAPIDLYREILGALGRRTTRASYLAAQSASLRSVLAPLYDELRSTRFSCEIAEVGAFLHIGSTREMLRALTGARALIRPFVATPRSTASTLKRRTGKGHALLLESSVDALHVTNTSAVLDHVHVGSATFGGGNIVVGINARTLELPAGISLFAVMIDGGRAHVACGIGDDCKTPLMNGGTVLDQPIAPLMVRCGVPTSEIICGDGTLWDARLWCVSAEKDPCSMVSWMWRKARAPLAWRKARRWSMRELLAQANGEISERARQDSADARLLQQPQLLQRELTRLVNPVQRAHVAARLSNLARTSESGTTSKRGKVSARLRTDAFNAVGEAVLAAYELPRSPPRAVILHDQAVWTSTPVRIDLAGGWSDTPPICNEVGGSVVNVAVTLRGQLPIQVVAKLEEELVIRIHSTDLGETRVIRTVADLAQRNDPTRWSALAESALVLAGAAPTDPSASLKQWLARVGGGISLTMFSAVPKGSGLGTSSILGGATIHCLDRVFGRERSPQELFAATSALEQMLSTRGGWQDQVGGLMGGFKLASTIAGHAQRPHCEHLLVPSVLLDELRARCVLYFTGERRMAKNILENVVWNWLSLEPTAVDAIHRLKDNAQSMRSALISGDVEAFAREIAQYMRLKRQIDPGCCPPMFDALAARFKRELAAWSFAGAGGGGFMLLVAKDARRAQALRHSIERDPPHPRARGFDFEMDSVGVRCAIL